MRPWSAAGTRLRLGWKHTRASDRQLDPRQAGGHELWRGPWRCRGKQSLDLTAGAGRPDVRAQFAMVAQGLRGVVAAVEHPGLISAGMAFEARVPARWLYRSA
jgi:hypothetical protein